MAEMMADTIEAAGTMTGSIESGGLAREAPMYVDILCITSLLLTIPLSSGATGKEIETEIGTGTSIEEEIDP